MFSGDSLETFIRWHLVTTKLPTRVILLDIGEVIEEYFDKSSDFHHLNSYFEHFNYQNWRRKDKVLRVCPPGC